MSSQRLTSNRTSQPQASHSDYTWEYEYYEIGPVSFEGLKAHKYSIVIGFWVGLAVFVIFMFFVLTLLTKTGAPHQEIIEAQDFMNKNTFVLIGHDFLSRNVSRLRHLDIWSNILDASVKGPPARAPPHLVEFDLPNFVNTDHSSSFAEDDLLISEPLIVLENKPVSEASRRGLD
ncbi:PREDICTED: melanocortin-2 receptor accessory protein 2 [Dipodomys ordii]|uniref:Melanocortin-2 receptor accessory protein 2 n=1 Tax=Dipodomys ordii TaxID=10020 RepID=A0A1S3GTR7_DIPOR|nr:PREDICTED: melanocortin-2 receptor accessory protein 2 [Dipodomys ordii]